MLFRRPLTVILLGLAFATLPSLTYATNSLGGYHWARTANPFTLKLVDNLTSSDWKSKLAQTSLDWNSPQAFSTTSPLVTAVIPTGWAGAALIETDNAGTAAGPQIAMDATGNAIAVWQQHDGVRYNIWAKRYTAGSGWGVATLIETDNAGNAYAPRVVMDAAGNAVAVWSQYDGARYNIWANRYTAGNGWGTATLIETDNAGSAYAPRVVMDATGNAVAVWHQYDRARIWANRYTAGSGWGTATLIETNNAGSGNPQIAMDTYGNGYAIVVWSAGGICWTNRYTDGSGWGTPTQISGNVGPAYNPKIAVDSWGNATAVWYQYDGTRFNIWANYYSVLSGGWGVATLIETSDGDTGFGFGSPEVAMDAIGNAIAVWPQYDGTRWNIWANRRSNGAWSGATLIETDNTGHALKPQIAMDAGSNTVVVWSQSDGTRDNIWANRHTLGGWGTATLIETNNAGSASAPQVAISANVSTAVWSQSDGTRYNIWANRFTAPNTSCAMVAGTTQVCNGNYGFNGWLGLAQIYITSSLHITQGSAKVNDTYLNTATYNNPNQRLHVMCQEVAHTFGLHHQSENGSSQNSCMDYFSNTGANATSTLSTKPNLHDFNQLNIIYSHLDSTTTLAVMTALTVAASGPVDAPKNWGYLRSQSANGRSSTYEKYHWDGSMTVTHVYWTNEAATKCSGCDHRYDQ